MGKGKRKHSRGEDALQETVRTVHGLLQHIDLFSRRMLREFGVSGPQLWALRTIALRSGLTIGELAGEMYLHISTVSVLLDRLEERGLVGRERSTSDRRVVRLQLTRSGREILYRAPEPPRSLLARGLKSMSARERIRLRDGVRRLARLMGMVRNAPASDD